MPYFRDSEALIYEVKTLSIINQLEIVVINSRLERGDGIEVTGNGRVFQMAGDE